MVVGGFWTLLAASNTLGQAGGPLDQPGATKKESSAEAQKVETPRVRHALYQGAVLRLMIEQRVGFTASQKEEFARLFEGFVAEARQNPADDIPHHVPLVEHDADQSGSLPKVNLGVVSVDVNVARFVQKTKELLKPEQAATFDRTLRRWAMFCPASGPRTGPLQQLRNAVEDPDMGLSASQAPAVAKILGDAFAEMREIGSVPSPEVVAEAAGKARVAVFEKLTAEQKTRVNENIKILQQASEFVLGPPAGKADEKKQPAADEKPKSPDDK